MNNKNFFLACVGVFLMTFVLFSFSLNGEFLDWDDSVNFVLNPHYRGLAWDNIKWMFTTTHMNHYQPLSWLTLGADYAIWGMNHFGYHLTAVIIHSLNALLFFLLAFKVLSRTDMGGGGNNSSAALFPAFLAALFFSLHPLRAESVSWITERRDILCGFFVLSSFLAYFNYAENCVPGEKSPQCRKSYYLSLFLCLCALLSKSMAVIIPPLFFVFDYFPLGRFFLPGESEKDGRIKSFLIKNRQILMEKLPFFALALIFAAVAYFWAGKPAGQPDYYAPSLAKGIYSYGFYLWKMLLPFGLVPVYPMPQSWILPNALSLIAMSAFLIFSLKYRNKNPLFLASFLYYFIALFPVCGLLNGAPQPASDRYTYLPMLPFAVIFGYLGGKMAFSAQKGRKFIFAGFLSVPLLLGGIAFFQQKAWSDSESLWLHQLEYDKTCAIAWNNLANVQHKKGNEPMALLYMTKAMDLKPDYPPYLCNAAKIHLAMGNNDAALSLFEAAIRLDPSRYDAEAGINFIKGNTREED